MYITFVFGSNYYWWKVLRVGQVLKLVKEPGNTYDYEAIRVECAGIGKVGYVANSVGTVVKGTYSAGRLYDKIKDESYCRILFITKNEAIGEVIENPNEDIEAEFKKLEEYVKNTISYYDKEGINLLEDKSEPVKM